MAVNAHFLKNLIADEMQTLSDARVTTHIQGMLVEPHIVYLGWDYGAPDQQYPFWVVFDEAMHPGAIAYCEFGFGARTPWGLVGLRDYAKYGMGMDSGWFPLFLDAYFESAASDLPIWRVFVWKTDGTPTAITAEDTWTRTWERVSDLRKAYPNSRYDCWHSIEHGSPPKPHFTWSPSGL